MLKHSRIKVHDTDIKPAIDSQSLRQGHHLTLRPTVTKVTDEKDKTKAAVHRQEARL